MIGGLKGVAVRLGGGGRRRPVTLAMATGRTETVIDRVDEWLRRQTFGGLVDRQELKNLLKDLVADDAYWVRQVVVCGVYACICVRELVWFCSAVVLFLFLPVRHNIRRSRSLLLFPGLFLTFCIHQRGTYDTIFDEVDTLLRREERPLKEILNPGYLSIYQHIYIYVCMYVCVCVCVYTQGHGESVDPVGVSRCGSPILNAFFFIFYLFIIHLFLLFIYTG